MKLEVGQKIAAQNPHEAHKERVIEAELTQALVEDTTWAYVAGVIDSEGTIGLSLVTDKRNNTKSLNAYILVSNTQYELVDYLNTRIAHSAIVKTMRGGRRKAIYRWQAVAWPIILVILKNCLPHLVLKREQAELLLEFYENRHDRRLIPGTASHDEHGRFLGHIKTQIPKEDLAYWQKMKVLNERGIPVTGLQQRFSEEQQRLI